MITLSMEEVQTLVAAIKDSNNCEWEPAGSAIHIPRELAIKLGMKPGDPGYDCTEEETFALMTDAERSEYYRKRIEADELLRSKAEARKNEADPVFAVAKLRDLWSK